MLDWTAAEERLLHISRVQIVRFLGLANKADVYGIGFFCDSYQGSVYLVANTEEYHLESLRDFEARYEPTDSEVFRWGIGNWKYPGGLFPSSSAEQREFDGAWKEYQEALSQIENDEKQGILESVCFEVLRRLIREGMFSTTSSLKGFTILGPDDRQEVVLEKKTRLDGLFEANDKQRRKMKPQISEDEIKKRLAQGGGRPLSNILHDLDENSGNAPNS